MKEIYKFEVMDYLQKGEEVYALLLTQNKPIVENAATIPGRLLARYIKMDDVTWYASEEAKNAEG